LSVATNRLESMILQYRRLCGSASPVLTATDCPWTVVNSDP